MKEKRWDYASTYNVQVREKGITLLALVITIIILLIITGVTLNAALRR